MYFADHGPPHFHVVYNEHTAVIGILDFSIMHGDLPPKALGLVMEWAKLHQGELKRDWDLAMQKQALDQIAPLE
jgi:hypothetical protein